MRSRHIGAATAFCSSILAVAAFATSSCDSGSGTDGGDQDVVNPNDTGMGGEGGGDDGSGGDGSSEAGDPNCSVKNCAKQVALGLEHACALLQDKSVRCWGLNSLGQLGYQDAGQQGEGGAFYTSNVGYAVANLGPAKALAAGFYHTCALLESDEIWCWGDNSYGQLALPADGGAQPPHVAPVKINAAPAGVTELKAGGWHTCALSGGMVTCWGRNDQGQQGSGQANDSGYTPVAITTPAAVSGVSGATHIGLGDQFTCVSNANNVQCFGNNSFGQLARGGDAGQPPFDKNPVNATGLGMVTGLAKSNGSHECALGNNVQCWGRNHVGQATGNGTASLTAPVTVMNLSGAVEVAPGSTHTCARVTGGDGGAVQCWGLNNHGQTGDMITDPEAGTPMPLAVKNLVSPLQVASGWGDFSCAVTMGGAVWCWGANFEGQLGRGGNATIGTCPTSPSSNGCDSTPQKVLFP